jgi:large-conductance mechanosensitive channel
LSSLSTMRRFRTRKLGVFLCIAVLVFAAFVSAVSSHVDAIFTPLWLIFPAVSVIVIRRRALRCDDQPVSLHSLVLSRAPPADFVLA